MTVLRSMYALMDETHDQRIIRAQAPVEAVLVADERRPGVAVAASGSRSVCSPSLPYSHDCDSISCVLTASGKAVSRDHLACTHHPEYCEVRAESSPEAVLSVANSLEASNGGLPYQSFISGCGAGSNRDRGAASRAGRKRQRQPAVWLAIED